jgi:hypothetical protein
MAIDLFFLVLLLVLAAWWRRRRRNRRYDQSLRPSLLSRRPPKHRARWLRLRLHLRLHASPGLATTLELLWHWGRWASYRESRRTRPSLNRWHRIRHPAEHSLFLGRAHYNLAVRVPVQEHGSIIGPPRSGKSALLSRLIMAAPGPVVSTSSKPDLFTLTSGIRESHGPVWVFNPQGIGGIPSNVRWSPLTGCHAPATAIRRGTAFASGMSTEGTEESSFWRREAAEGLQGLFAAAALAGRDMLAVGQWAGSPRTTPEAAAILAAAGLQQWSDKVAELNGPAEKTAQTIRTVMSSALSFLRDPVLAAAVVPGDVEQFDIDKFLTSRGTLYMLARTDGDDSTLGPLFAALASEIQHHALQLASRMPRGRLDPPLLMALDEVTQICPVPLPAWLADAGGQGICIWTAFHGLAQLRARWKEVGAQTVIDTSNVKVVMPGLADADTISQLSRLCGQVAWGRDHGGWRGWHDVLSADMIRRLPAGFPLLLRGSHAPVIVSVAKGWRHPDYRRLRRQNQYVTTVMHEFEEQPRMLVSSAVGSESRVEASAPQWPTSPSVTNGEGHRGDGTAWWVEQ